MTMFLFVFTRNKHLTINALTLTCQKISRSLIFTQLFYPGCQNTVTGCVRPGAAVFSVATIHYLLSVVVRIWEQSRQLRVTTWPPDTGHGPWRAEGSTNPSGPHHRVHTDKLFVGSEGNSGNECKDLLNSMRYPQAPEPCEQPTVVSAAPLLRHHRRGHRQGGGQVGAVQYSTVQCSTVQCSTVQ